MATQKEIFTEAKNGIDSANHTVSGLIEYLRHIFGKLENATGGGGGSSQDYSTTEREIGKWIDGSTVYQKTINFGSIPSSTTKEVAHNISNLGAVIEIEGVMNNLDGVTFETLPAVDSSNFRVQVNATNIKIITSTSWTSWTNSYITLKYTKAS